MADYKAMYLEMVHSAEDAEELIDNAVQMLVKARNMLQHSRAKSEDIYIETSEN